MTKRKRIPVEAESVVSCDRCTGACCRAGTAIGLTQIERFNHAAKLSLKAIVAPEPFDRWLDPLSSLEDPRLIPAGLGIYEMQQDCGYLTEDSQCAIYDDPNRPQACASMEVESISCLVVRANAGFEDILPLSTRVVIDAALADM